MEDLAQQLKLCEDTIRGDWSVRKLEQKVQDLAHPRVKEEASPQDLPPVFSALAEQVGRHFNDKVAVRVNPKGNGTITIRFDNEEQVQAFLDKLNPQA